MKDKKFVKIILLLLFCICGAGAVSAQTTSILDLADRYSVALRKYERQKGRSSAEKVFDKGEAVAVKIREMEALNDEDYLRLQKKMRGYDINREEILFIEADAVFFKALSKKHGTRADVMFFDLIKRVKPDNVWAAYVEQQTDVTSCTRYGKGLLTGLYGSLLKYRKTFPSAYKVSINDELTEIVDHFSDSGCACGNKASVVKEFRMFIKAYPSDRHTPSIRKNLEVFRKAGDFRFNCQSG